jgi:hypothetical protein
MITKRKALDYARVGERGRHWYRDARAQIGTVCERNLWDTDKFTAILAVTSPRVAVRRNIRTTFKYMLGDDWTNGTIRSVRTSVKTWEDSGVIKGPKTGAFYRNLSGCNDSICLDTWMAYAFCVDKGKVNYVGIGGQIKTIIRSVATTLGWAHCEVQAAIWTAIMAESGRTDQPFCIEEVDREFLPF